MKAGLLTQAQIRHCKVAGGAGLDIYTQGGVNNTNGGGRCAWVDMNFVIGSGPLAVGAPNGGDTSTLGIYVLQAGYTVVSNGGAHGVALFICPESERQNQGAVKPNQPYTSNQNGPPQTVFEGFLGSCIASSHDGGSTTVQGQTLSLRRAIYIPRGFFLRCAELNSAAASDCCALEFDFVVINDPCADIDVM